MILVTVGTHPQGFDRLVKAADELAAQLEEQVIIQYGSSTYQPRYATAFRWTTGQEMERLTAAARVVVSHAAAGAIILALRSEKPLVLVPRLKKYNEVIDDHQLAHACALTAQNRAISVETPTTENLSLAIEAASGCQMSADCVIHLVEAIRQTLFVWRDC